jgi:PAS domain S-box-containing protein
MDEAIDNNIIALEDNANLIVQIFFVLMFFIAIILAVVIARSVSAPIVLLDRVVKSVTKGLKNQEILLDKIKSQDEIGSLARNIQILLRKIKGLLQQASEKNTQLEEFNQQEAKRAWFNEGLAMFNEILRQSNTDVEEQTIYFISELVKYTKSQQGALFLVQINEGKNIEDTKEYLELKGSYAYQRQKSNRKPFEKGEELIGSVWEKGKTLHLQNLPESYTQIHSAMGTIAPKSLLIIPIWSDDVIVGVLELLSVSDFETYQIDWIEAVVRRLGTSLTTLQTHIKTKYFLSESEKQAKESQESETKLQKQVEEYQHWIVEFENKVNNISEESLIFTTVLGKMFSGIVVTDEYFRIRQMNGYLTKKLGFRRNELVGKPLELFLETDYRNIIDWKERSQDLSFTPHTPLHTGKIRQRQGDAKSVEVISGKLQTETRIVYVFLLNEYTESELLRNGNGKLKPNIITEKKV